MQPDQSETDRQYLKAIGIDLWVARDDDAADDDVTTATPDAVMQVEHASAELAEAAADVAGKWSAATLQSAFKNLNVAKTAAGPAELLVVTEGAELSTESAQLLNSMFKAIKMDASAWLQVTTAPRDEQSIALGSLLNVVEPKAVVYMAGSGGSLSSLDALRGIKHQPEGIAPFAVVTFHPQDLIDNPDAKRPAWEDLKQLRQWLG